ncbi:S-layer homology domain-containing protein [Gudongella sp. DL1XJH-153]|uniref:S-layer homology domain-containing protein n=1 Tax=Gudongella sp. DL1XJH-153 TaxID=3409804 RepID=UPI003BB76DA5
MNKKILSLMLVLVMILGSFSFVSAQTGNEKVDWLIEEGLVLGDSGGYRLNDPIRRSEVAAMVTRALDAESAAVLLETIPSAFSDVPVSHWANGYVNYATSMEYVNGYPNGTFGPDRNISYAELITILVRTTETEVDTSNFTGDFWATPYIIEAIEQGITEGVTIPGSDYNAAASREKVFEMVYNTVMKRLMADREVYKAIFVENERIGDLDENEVMVVILAEGENSPEAELRYEKDDEELLVLSPDMDSEMLLGKVADITIDKDDNILSAVIDTSFDYYTGPFAAMDLEVMLNTGDYFDVIEEASSSRSIEQLYGVYLNEEAYGYLDYVEDNDSSDGTLDGSFVAEFARVTVKDDVVFFIESYMFDDIAPVIDVEDDGEELYVRSDYPSADEDVYFLDSVVGFENGDFMTMGLEDVSVGDVLHVYDDFGIVRTDGQFTGEYERIRESSDVFYVEIDDELFQIRATNNKRPVYSLNGTGFFTLFDINADGLLEYLEDEDVMFILDVNDSLQLISGELEYNEKTVLVMDSGTRDIYVIEKDGSEESYRTDNYSVLMRNPSTEGNMADFYRGIIAYLVYDDNIVDRIVRIADPVDIDDDAELVLRDARDRFDIDLENMDIRLADDTYDYNDNTNIFVLNLQGDVVTRIDAMTMENVLDMAEQDSDLRAYVITNEEFTIMDVGNEMNFGNSDEIAHTIVFTDFVLDDEFVEKETLLLEFAYDPDRDDSVEGENSEGDTMEIDIAEFAVIPELDSGELVRFTLENGMVIDAEILLDSESEEYQVIDIDTRNERITLDIDGTEEEFWLAPDYEVFGATSVDDGDMIAVIFNPEVDVEIEIIFVR